MIPRDSFSIGRAVAIAAVTCLALLTGCESAPRLFIDVAEEQDLEFIAYSGDNVWYLIDTLGCGLAAGDADGDGQADLFLLTGSAITDEFQDEAAGYRNALWKNDKGRFADVTADSGLGIQGWSNGAVFADYDGDGDLDVFVARHGPNMLFRNNGEGVFQDVSEEAGVGDDRWGVSAAFGDLDGDGDLDLYVTNYAEFDSHEQKGTVNWFTVKQFPSFFEPTTNQLLRNNGDGTFTDVTDAAGVPGTGRSMGVLAFDYDDDGDQDLFVCNDVGFNDLYENQGELRFENVGLFSGVACDAEGNPQASMGTAAGDFDGDGDFDIIVTHYGGEYHTLYRNDGEGLFTDITHAAGLVSQSTMDTVGWGVGFYDFDLDGHLDILSVNGHVVSTFILRYLRWNSEKLANQVNDYRIRPESFNMPADQPNHLFLGQGDGTFRDASEECGEGITGPRMSRGAAFADFDDDGRIDVAVSNKNQPAQVLLNRMPPKGSWIKLELRAPAPNVFAVGAKVRVDTELRSHHGLALAGTSYSGGDDTVLHFGLGAAKTVTQIEVRWPDGQLEQFTGIEPEQTQRLVKGSGQIAIDAGNGILQPSSAGATKAPGRS